MSFFGIFGGIFNFIIFIAIANAIYKQFIKGKSETLDTSIKKFVNQVKDEINGTTSSNQGNKSSRPTNYKLDKPHYKSDDQFTTNIEGSYSNAEDLLKSGLITKEEYRKIKRR